MVKRNLHFTRALMNQIVMPLASGKQERLQPKNSAGPQKQITEIGMFKKRSEKNSLSIKNYSHCLNLRFILHHYRL